MMKLGRKCTGIRQNWLGYGQDKEIGGDKKDAQQGLKGWFPHAIQGITLKSLEHLVHKVLCLTMSNIMTNTTTTPLALCPNNVDYFHQF